MVFYNIWYCVLYGILYVWIKCHVDLLWWEAVDGISTASPHLQQFSEAFQPSKSSSDETYWGLNMYCSI